MEEYIEIEDDNEPDGCLHFSFDDCCDIFGMDEAFRLFGGNISEHEPPFITGGNVSFVQ